jgi:glycosyltransferase involved in cell wall biosynthesis
MPKKVVFCVPSIAGPTAPFVKALENSLPAVLDGGHWIEGYVEEIGNPYISAARATMLRKALDAKADVIVFLDYDLSWRPQDLRKLIDTEGDVVSGTYRFKQEPENYMGSVFSLPNGTPFVRADGCIKARETPAGFLKITKEAVEKFMTAYPELVYGPKYHPYVDIFNHGAIDGTWWGEDYAFCLRWNKKCGDIWVVPDLDLDHHLVDKKDSTISKVFKGNFHRYLLRQPGGSESDCPNLEYRHG